MTEAQECYDLIKEFFEGDPHKTITWFNTKIPGLGYIRPIEMINNRRSDKLLKFIKSQLEGNHP